MGKTQGKRHFEDLGVDRRIILKWFFKKCNGVGMELIDVAQYRDRRWAPTKVAMKVRFHKMREICSLYDKQSVTKGLCFIQQQQKQSR
jgi:hypothetical protein